MMSRLGTSAFSRPSCLNSDDEASMSDSRLPRREFIATGVGLAAAALTSTRAGAVSPNDKINVGIVGCGVRGNYILGEAIAAGAGRINVVGICDVWTVARDKMAAALADKHGMKPQAFTRTARCSATSSVRARTLTSRSRSPRASRMRSPRTTW
jgi:hypothetical protein